jgi:hypothetical protein
LANYLKKKKQLLLALDEVYTYIQKIRNHISDFQKKFHTGAILSNFSSDPKENFINQDDNFDAKG